MICRICDGKSLDPVIDLGQQPWCNDFLTAARVGTESRYPLRVVYCHDCRTAQLDFTVKKEVMFGDHTYLSGVTRSLSAHFHEVAKEVHSRFLAGVPRPRILDIGSNDGTQLKHFQALGCDVLGVESSKTTAALANSAGVPTLNSFFNEQTAADLGDQFDVIGASGVFFHLEELHSVCIGIKRTLRPGGVFVVQFLYMRSIQENLAFDQIYHEHLLYYTLETIQRLLERHGLEMFDARLSPIHGGSIIGFVSHAGRSALSDRLKELRSSEQRSGCNDLSAYTAFARRIDRMREENLAFLSETRRQGKTVFGFGAPVKGNTLLNYFGVGRDLISCLVEKNPLRDGLFSPGMHIPVILEKDVKDPPDVYYVLAWNFKREILASNQALVDRGVNFYFPVDPDRVIA